MNSLEERSSEILDIYKEFFNDPNDSEPDPDSQKIECVVEGEPLSEDAAERLQELFEANPIFKDDLYTPTPVGKRSDAEFHLCARLWEAGFSEAEIYVIMSTSPQTKWTERDGNYRQETIRKAIVSAEANHKKKIDEEAKKEVAKKAAPIELKDIADIEYDDKGKTKKVRFSPTFAAEVVLERLNLAMSEDSEDVYHFTGQIYKPDGARKIDRALSKAAADLFNAYQLRETLRRVKNDLLEHPVVFDPDPYLLGVKNGVANLLTGEVREYRAEDLILDQIPASFDPAAKCPAFLAFLESITPNVSDRITLIDWFVANAIKEPFAYVLFLLGLGRNGKGVYEKLLKKFFGSNAFRDMELAQAVKNNFAASQFYRKRGWIASETEKQKGKTIIGTDFIKMVSGSGTIDSDRKNQSRIQFDPYFKTIVDTNNMPRIEDQSRGWKERFIKTDLPYAFLVNPDPNNPLEKLRDPDILKRMSTPSELSGILNLVLFRAQSIGKSCTIHKRPAEEMFAEYAEQSFSVNTFLEMFCEYANDLSGLKTPSGPIYEAYKEWCGYTVGEVVDDAYFGKQLKKFCGGREPTRPKTKDRKSIRVYQGLIFDEKKHRVAIEALQTSMSPDVSCMSLAILQEEEEKQGQCIVMSPVSLAKLWKLIIKKFGNPSNVQKCTMKENPFYKRKDVKMPETPATLETSASSKPVDENPTGDNPGAMPETKTIEADLLRADEQTKAKEEHFKTPTKKPDEPIICAVCGADLAGKGRLEKNGKVYCAQPGCGYPKRREEVRT